MKRSKKGFSLTELLTVVAIMGILMAVAVPALTAVSRKLKMRDLDDTAREIFLAAQNTLTAQKASGTIPKPAQGAESGTDCYWLFDDAADNRADLLLPDGAVESAVAANHIAIKYNAEYAVVLEVYYGERQNSYASQGCKEWNESDIMRHVYSDSLNPDTAPGARAQMRIGYYNGSDLSRDSIVQLLVPFVEIINGEDSLYVDITITNPAKQISEFGASLTVRVEEDGHPERFKEFSFTQGECGTGHIELTLDSLENSGKMFKEVMKDAEGNLTVAPGANIRVTATLSAPDKTNADGTVTRYLSARGSDEDNSLFADRMVTGSGKDTVYIANARHLKNLNADYSTAGGTFDPENGALFAEQTENIEWPAGSDYPSIPNGSGEIASFDGKKLEIKGLQGGNGLFANAGSAALTGIRIVNPQIKNTGGNVVGALAGEASGAVITDCRVYATTITADRTAEDYDALGTKFVVKGGTVGGLLGSAENCTIRNSFAALSQVSGTVAGGFIGNASGCDIKQCYATAEDLSGTSQSAMFVGNISGGSVKNCYAVGNISGGTTISGFANGTADITDSYCAVTYESGGSLTIQNGFAGGGGQTAKGNRYLRVSGNIGNESGAVGRDELLETEDDKKLSDAQTHPYRSELDGKAYPFFGLGMPHYGSWPVQTVNGIKLFDGNDPGSRELKYILVPKGGSATFWVEAQSDDKAAMVEPEVGSLNGTVLDTISAGSYDPATGRKSVTVKGSLIPGTTYVDLTAEGITLRAVVVVYEAEVTLLGKNLKTGFTATGKADQTGTGSIGHLSLRTDGKVGEFTASRIKIVPTESSILSELSAMQSSLGAQGTLSATAADFDSWEKLKDGDPAVTANGNPGAGSNILAPVGGNYYPTADSTGKLTVTGVASGTAAVSARWAIDEKVAAKCDVKMEGARALIQAVSATGADDSILGAKDNYPYYLGIRAEPGETVSLSFTPKLFGGSGTGQSYTWTISGGALKAPITAPKAVSGGSGDEWTCPLKGNTGWHTYTVKLEYTNDLGERSVDYMTFSIYCAAKKQDTACGAIKFEKVDGQGFLNGDKASVEQINGSISSGYEHTAELELQSWVEGANNTRVKWFYSTDGGTTWNIVTGQLGSIPVYETLENGTTRMRATVQWMNNNLEYGGKATGGAIKIVGLDTNEYDSDFTFKLRAEAAEATENGEAIAAARIVDVTVMRKLQIDPQSTMIRAGNSVTLTANRDTIRSWSYQWSISSEDNSNLSSTSNKTTNVTISAQSVSRTVTLTFGPHTSSATVGTVSEGIFSGSSKTGGYINRDGIVAAKDYFLVEKGTTRSLDFSWITSTDWGGYSSCLYGEPSGDTKLGFELKSDEANTELGTYRGNKNWTTAGERHYLVTGEEFTGNTADTLEWKLQQRGLVIAWYAYTDISVFADFYVVGMDLKQGSTIVSDSATPVSLSAPADTKTLTADWSFPAELMVGTEPTITWTVDNPELVAFGIDIASEADTASGESVSIVARKYSATDYSATITATCTIQCVNGREYTYKKYVSVVVPPASGMTVSVEPCIASDIAGLNGAFGDALTVSSLLAAVDGSGTPVLIRDSAFGCDTLYLKIRAGMSGGFANLNDYFCNLYIDRSFVDMDTALSSDGTTMYVRLKAKEATADVYHLELRTAIGSAPVHKRSIDLYAYPEVALTRKVEGVTQDVTNGSIPVYLNETDLSITLNAALTPVLYSADDMAKETPLDQIQWYLQEPDGYDAQSYLELSAEEGNEVTLSIRDEGRMPDFRVVLHARSTRSDVSDAGYALVFLPVIKS